MWVCTWSQHAARLETQSKQKLIGPHAVSSQWSAPLRRRRDVPEQLAAPEQSAALYGTGLGLQCWRLSAAEHSSCCICILTGVVAGSSATSTSCTGHTTTGKVALGLMLRACCQEFLQTMLACLRACFLLQPQWQRSLQLAKHTVWKRAWCALCRLCGAFFGPTHGLAKDAAYASSWATEHRLFAHMLQACSCRPMAKQADARSRSACMLPTSAACHGWQDTAGTRSEGRHGTNLCICMDIWKPFFMSPVQRDELDGRRFALK